MAIAIWVVMLLYTIGYCSIHGYQDPKEPLTFVLGIPSWVFWGVFLPWIVCVGITAWFAFAFMKDSDLEHLGVSTDDPLVMPGDSSNPPTVEPPDGV